MLILKTAQVAMMSRITLNLRREARSDGAILSQLHMTTVHASNAYTTHGDHSYQIGKRRGTVSNGTSRPLPYVSAGKAEEGFGLGGGYNSPGDLKDLTGLPAMRPRSATLPPIPNEVEDCGLGKTGNVTFDADTLPRPDVQPDITISNSFLSMSSHGYGSSYGRGQSRNSIVGVDVVDAGDDFDDRQSNESWENETEHRTRLNEHEVYALRSLRAKPV